MDDARIDSHKLMFHPERVAAWLRGENVPPLYMEISPSGACNHRCVFCGLDFMGYRPAFLDTALLTARLTELGAYGLKSLMFAGEGEPLLHKDMPALARHARASGIDVAFTTNGVFLAGDKLLPVLEASAWIKVSCNAGTAARYARIHGTRPGDFERVLTNLEQAVAQRDKRGLSCTLGLQTLLLPEVVGEMEGLAKRCRDIGLDYFVVKPYSRHPQSHTPPRAAPEPEICRELARRLAPLADDRFTVVFRQMALEKQRARTRPYTRCLGLPFWSYLDASGNVWGCSMYLGDDRFFYGNIAEASFREIWEGPRRRASLDWVAANLDAGACRLGCRLDEINRYLWALRHPHPHVNFI